MQTDTFLHKVALDLYARYGENLSKLVLVFPSRRAQLFFIDSLSKILDQPLWEPSYASLDDIVQQYTKLNLADDFSLMIKLYALYVQHTKSKESFDHFYFWGETLLNDFDEIDRYRVDARLLLLNLANQKVMEGDYSFLSDEQINYLQSFWSSFNPRKEGKLQSQFIEVWDVLHALYLDFRSQLYDAGDAYLGMIYRDMADNLLQLTHPKDDTIYIFVGFNALGACEEVLFQFLKKHNKADFYWDYDNYYINNLNQEAGLFIRNNQKKYPAPTQFKLTSNFVEPKNIRIIAAPTAVLQAKMVPQLLAEFDLTPDKLRDTALVLADENLLIPTLHALPEWLDEINVTLAYPLSQTPVFTLVEMLITLQLSYQTEKGFYYKDVLTLLQHQYITALSEKAGHIVRKINEYNWVYVQSKLFADDPILQLVFQDRTQGLEMIGYFKELFAYLAVNIPEDQQSDQELRNEYIFVLTKALNRFENALTVEHLQVGMPVFLSLLRTILSKLKIPFAGEPVRGLQIMGMLETRNIDFKNIILLSANEKVLPAAQVTSSFIPYHLRRTFAMPTQEMKEAVSAYHFYRLLQRAEQIYLLYSSKTAEDRSGEMSRYLYQLKFESPHKIEERNLLYPIIFKDKATITVSKTSGILDRLRIYLGTQATTSLSPSAISTYISCPLQFYFSRVAQIKPSEVIQEELAVNVLGDILHAVMEELYAPFLNKTMTVIEIAELIAAEKDRLKLLNRIFSEKYFKTNQLPADFNQNGKLLIARDVLRKYIRGILKVDTDHPNFKLLGFESRHATMLPFKLNEKTYLVNVGGIIDRVDEYQGAVRIIDYKTGGGRGLGKRMSFAGVASLFDVKPEVRNKEVFQTFLYALVYHKSHPQLVQITPALYFVRDALSPKFTYLLNNTETNELVYNFIPYASEFSDLLSNCLSELFNPKIPFYQTSHLKTCSYCPFNTICGRQS